MKAQPEAERMSIRRQATARLAGVMLVLLIGIPLIGFNFFHTRQQREVTQKVDATRSFYADLLPRHESKWQVEAEQLRQRIEFTRILEDRNDARWSSRLNTFLTAQWEFIGFTNLLILAPNGSLLFHYGTESGLSGAADKSAATGWHFDENSRELYRVFQMPLWLGAGGEGRLVLFKPINAGALQQLLSPETHLHVYGFGTLIASSTPELAKLVRPGQNGLHKSAVPPLLQIELRWPHNSPQAPTLLIQREFHDSFTLVEFMLRPLAVIVLITLLLWLGLGRWLTHTVRRIESLGIATRAYAEDGSATGAAGLLEPARAKADEIGDVAVTMEHMMERVSARDSEQRSYLDTLAMLDEAVLELDQECHIALASPGWYRLTHSPDKVEGISLTEFIHRDDADTIRALSEAFKRGDKSQAQLRLRLRNEKGHDQWAECRMIAQRGKDGSLGGIRGVLRDITQTYLHEQQITHMALHDALTDLPNRILLEDRIKIALRMASRSNRGVAICFIDLDHFKKINDTLGHKAGDRLLVAFSAALRSQLRAGDTLARWGGDEFVLLLPELAGRDDAREVARKIENALKKPMPLDDAEYVVTFSMGAALYPDDAKNPETLLAHADRAMFYAKTQGRNQTCFFGEISDKGSSRQELYIQNKLAEAIASRRIQAWFQPIVAADGGGCQLVEVLARWHDAEFGWVSPATFIPIAESTGLIREVGQQIWEQTLAALIHWREKGLTMRAALNISKRQLFSEHFAEQMVGQLAKNGFAMDAVTIEVTESIALLEAANAPQRLHDLHHIGFHVAIDDFGTGYSALSQLHEMPVDELKIDISFVRRIHETSGQSIVRAIIQFAKALQLTTIAEGVEDQAAAELLTSMGVDYLQGFHFGRPMPLAEFDAWLLGRR
jgi:diguanylate cyclase (GGDEF)-like protein/PAS domain S-box-containing protein